ncbi:MAG: hypothetical protein QF773_08175, partial [Lentisphaeria bacterium]|nr:hypothetical protein [Lentisphaeria bacterium]
PRRAARALVDGGADIEAGLSYPEYAQSGFTPLHEASSAGRAGMLAAMTIAYFAVVAIHELSQYR